MISVIVPVYNAEEYLERCVNSILRQTCPDLEVLLVDDGSRDSSGAMCDAFAAQDSRVRVLHQENSGISAARNAGLSQAKGDYIGFVDSDDWIDPDMYESLYALCREYEADIAECSYRNVFHDEIREERENCGKIEILSPVQAMENLVDYRRCRPTVWNKLYSRKVAVNIRYPEGKLHEDEFVTPLYYLAAQKIAVTDQSFYNYEHRNSLSVTSSFSLRHLSVCEAFRQRLDLMDSHPQLREIKEKLCNSYCQILFWQIGECIRYDTSGPDLLETVDKALGEYRRLSEQGTDIWHLKQLSALKELRDRFVPAAAVCPPEEKEALWHEGAKEWLFALLSLREQRIEELSAWAAEQEQAKTFFENQSRMKDARIGELEKWCGTLDETNKNSFLKLEQREEQLRCVQARLDLLLEDKMIRGIIKMKKIRLEPEPGQAGSTNKE